MITIYLGPTALIDGIYRDIIQEIRDFVREVVIVFIQPVTPQKRDSHE
jgi:hypothetical protein